MFRYGMRAVAVAALTAASLAFSAAPVLAQRHGSSGHGGAHVVHQGSVQHGGYHGGYYGGYHGNYYGGRGYYGGYYGPRFSIGYYGSPYYGNSYGYYGRPYYYNSAYVNSYYPTESV